MRTNREQAPEQDAAADSGALVRLHEYVQRTNVKTGRYVDVDTSSRLAMLEKAHELDVACYWPSRTFVGLTPSKKDGEWVATVWRQSTNDRMSWEREKVNEEAKNMDAPDEKRVLRARRKR